MGNTFKYTLLSLIRMPGVLVWALAFPLIMSTIFMMMFQPLEEEAEMDPVRIAIVQPDESAEGQAFQAFLEALSDEGEDSAESSEDDADEALFTVTYAADAAEAERIVQDSLGSDDPYTGYVQLEEGEPDVHVTGSSDTTGIEKLRSSILAAVMDSYVANSSLIRDLMAQDPLLASDSSRSAQIAELVSPLQATEQITVTENQPQETVRFYFALLGMAALFGGSLGLAAFQRLKPNTSALGARRAVGATSHGRTVAATVAATWVVSFACLFVAYLYMRFVAGVDFAGHDGECLLVTAVSALLATALGCAISCIPHVPEDGKNGILTGIVCFASFFAGLYGQPTMELADEISRAFPAADWVNPATQISQAFYSIMYYSSPGPLMGHVAILLIMTALLFILSARSLRRRRYASL